MRIEITPEHTVAYDDRGEPLWVANTTNVATGLLNQRTSPQNLLPPAVRWIGPAGRAWAWERPPRLHHVIHVEDGDKHSTKVWLPWTVEMLDVISGELFVFARNSPLSSMDDGICHLPLPGMKEDGRVPLPKLRIEGSAETMIHGARHAFDTLVWTGQVNDRAIPPEWTKGAVYNQWSKLDLLGATSVGWRLAKTFNELTKPYEEPLNTSLYEVFEKAAGFRK